MAIRITHIRMSSGGSGHEHITDYQWTNETDGAVGNNSKAAMVAWIDDRGVAYVGTGPSRANVGVVRPRFGDPYLRTFADGIWTNNLLSLPRF